MAYQRHRRHRTGQPELQQHLGISGFFDHGSGLIPHFRDRHGKGTQVRPYQLHRVTGAELVPQGNDSVAAVSYTHLDVYKRQAKYIQAILDGEVNVHNGYMADFGITQEELDHTPIQQDNRSYTSYMLSVAYRGGEAEILTAIFSCAYSYEVIARKIVEECPSAPEHPMYGRWVRGYITPRYTGNNVILKDMLERLTKDYTEEQLRYLEEIFTACSRYEASFWDMADRFGTEGGAQA